MIPTFETIDELWLDAVETVLTSGHKTGSRDGETTEILGYCGRLLNPKANVLFNPIRKINLSYAAAELLWYLSNDPSIDMIKAYAPQYERFANDGKAWGAYGARLCESGYWNTLVTMHNRNDLMFLIDPSYDVVTCDQLQGVAKLLIEKPESRQAVISLWQAYDLPHAIAGDKNDMPCTLTLQFIIRNGKLNLFVNMRSNDLWLGTPYDIFCFTCIQQLLAEVLHLDVGFYQHHAGSLHIYERNKEKAAKALKPTYGVDEVDFAPHSCYMRKGIDKALVYEAHNRKISACAKDTTTLGVDSLLEQMVVWASLKFTDSGKSRVIKSVRKLC